MVSETDGSGDAGSRQEKRSRDEKVKPPKMVPVKVIRREGESLIVEHNDRWFYVPVSIVDDKGRIPEPDLKAAPRYGVEWEDAISPVTIEPKELAACFRASGIRTLQDMERNMMGAKNCLASLLMQSVVDIYKKAKEG